mmetsp:Transcript_18348/g.22482  ORF Transcript_18348/g.22482 Transcript_18348/m.22482 type:complete len:307 (-) Transcript_18348:227-1147(-)|eukprot:CAMPEP_0204860806 /NCGR_PEP_ID=MMETSP1348-20121228/899_1 /ASSEMBLY_ACC=CAM_ASM_000700 /TAXON_ID=215587 /ORGANISM="Aplanochytrium stocchinoi, Strain GSBS06" /LENGTH=306 /DNA_ID=CAMNT_0052009799 /DNA_START=463 /DNA_END=1383 /DNA_ORIENTATION=+
MSVVVNGDSSGSSKAMQHQSQTLDHHEREKSLQLKQNTSTRKNLLFLAKIAERAQRYDDMKYYIKEVVLLDANLNDEERNMLAVSYKNALSKRRISWKLIQKMKTARLEEKKQKQLQLQQHQAQGEEQESMDDDNKSESQSIEDLGLDHLGDTVKVEIETTCHELISLMQNHLLTHSTSIGNDRATVFYSKTTGDYFRYLTELDPMATNTENGKKASFYYEKALALAENALKPSDPIRLGLVLNMSVFFYEVMKKPDKACLLANHAHDNAISELDKSLPLPQTQKETSLILDLLRNNLELWTSTEN